MVGAKTVFIIGAGASRSADAPLMYDFIDSADMIYKTGRSGWARQSFENIRHARRRLQSAFVKSNIDLDNVEELFSTLEMAKLIGRIGTFDSEVVDTLTDDLTYLIMRTIEQSIQYEINGENQTVDAPYPYPAFADLIIELSKNNNSGPVSIVSFNYDLCLEYALLLRGYDVNYGLDMSGKPKNNKNVITLYKVHGSLNWSQSGNNLEIKVAPPNIIETKSIWDRLGLDVARKSPIDTMELLLGPDGWGQEILPRPIIVPPTWNKGKYQEMFSPVWKNASSALSTAENIFVIGYSLPKTDHFFKSFYSISTISDSIIDSFKLYDPAQSDEIESRYRDIVGSAILRRGKFQHRRCVFSRAIKEIAGEFGLHVTDYREY